MNDEIEKALDEVEKSIEIKKERSIIDDDEISDELIKMVEEDRKKADEIFDLFYTNLAMKTDRSEASKEALTKALELKIEASKNIIELLKVKTKNNFSGNALFFNTLPPKKTGIDINNIKKDL